MADSLEVGTILMWYRIDAILGRGGFGITYLATDTNLGKHVAIKEYLPGEISSRNIDSRVHPRNKANIELYRWGLQRFLEEARILARFKHENIVSVLAVFEENNTAYMVMEYEQGRDLESVVHLPGYQSEKVLLDIFTRLADGLAVVHEQNIIHRDIKPANIFIREDGNPVLLDFGSARQSISGKSRVLTRILTKGYAPYEQIDDNGGHQGPWTDIYSMGATLYYIISGGLPADALSRLSGIARVKLDPLKPVAEVIPADKYSLAFTQGIDAALQFEVEDRPQSVSSFIELLSGNTVGEVEHADQILENNQTVLSETVFYSGHEREASLRRLSSIESKQSISNRELGSQTATKKLLGYASLLILVGALFYLYLDSSTPVNDGVIQFGEEHVVTPVVQSGGQHEDRVGKSEVTPEAESVATPEVESVVTPEVESAVTPEVESAVTPEAESVATPEVESVATPEVESVVTPEVESVVTPEVESVVTPEVESAVTPEVESVVTPEVESVVTPAAEPEVIPEVQPVVIPEAEPVATPEANPVVMPKKDPISASIENKSNTKNSRDGLVIMTERLQSLIKALELLDNERLQEISNTSPETKALLDGIASRYKSSKVSISSLRVLESQGVAKAVIGLDKVFRSNGEPVTPGDAWNRFTVTMKKEDGDWGLLEW